MTSILVWDAGGSVTRKLMNSTEARDMTLMQMMLRLMLQTNAITRSVPHQEAMPRRPNNASPSICMVNAGYHKNNETHPPTNPRHYPISAHHLTCQPPLYATRSTQQWASASPSCQRFLPPSQHGLRPSTAGSARRHRYLPARPARGEAS